MLRIDAELLAIARTRVRIIYNGERSITILMNRSPFTYHTLW